MEPTAARPSGKVWFTYLVAGFAVTGAYFLVPRHGSGLLARVVLYCVVSASAAVAVGIGVLRARPRPALPWLLLGLSQAVYAAADTTFYVLHYLCANAHYPSTADVLYLAHYPLVVAGLVLVVRRRVPGRDLPGLLDAGMLAVTAALLSWVYLIGPQARFDSEPLAKLASVAYPVMDLAMLAVALRLVLSTGRRPASFYLLVANLAGIMTADTLYVAQQVRGNYDTGNFLDLIWLAGNLSLGAAALHPTMGWLCQPSHARDRTDAPARVVALGLAALVTPGMLLLEYAGHSYRDIPVTACVCAVLFTLTIARLLRMVADHRRVASTDLLTGLGTRRYVEDRLAMEVARARRRGTEVAVFIIDVDRFKSINDRYGHPAGDRALIEIAARLRAATRPTDVLARYGGEEFAVLISCSSAAALAPLADDIRRQVSRAPIAVAAGTDITVTVSVGAVSFPHTATTPADLVAAADQALYRAKARGRDRVVIGEPGRPGAARDLIGDQVPMMEYLRQAADEVDRWLSASEHSAAISRWAAIMSRRLGLDQDATWRLEVAGRLHDIGKIVLPIEILTKPSALTVEEWRLLREHPDNGARLAQLVPGFGGVAEVIRQHHERFDGAGYPDRLAGTAIRLEARIIAVCDSWAAMRSNRAYQAALTEDQARAQLHGGRGSQFDPDLVDLFLDLHASGEVGRLGLLVPAAPVPTQPAAPAVAAPGTGAGAGAIQDTAGSTQDGAGSVQDTAAASASAAKVFQKLIS